jgi:hypothetical protein
VSSTPLVKALKSAQEAAEYAADLTARGYALCQRADEARQRRDGALAAVRDRDGAALIRMGQAERKAAVLQLRALVPALDQDAHYAELVSTCGHYSEAVLRHLLSKTA